VGTIDEDIYTKHAEDLVRFAMGLVGRSDAQDVVSAAVLRSITSSAWPRVRNHRAYLYRAVLNQARNDRRDRKRRLDKESRGAHGERSPQSDYRPEVLEAVKSLSVRQRAVIVLTYWEDLHPIDVAARIGISEGSVRRHLARARSKLRGLLHE
jgi:RNA polymerase sigma factor (sigma-70 family)